LEKPNRVRITARTLAGLKPAEGQRDYWDATLPRFGVRVSPNGVRSFCILYRVNGKPKRVTLGQHPPMLLHEARDRAEKMLRDVDDGNDPVSPLPDAPGTFGALAKQFLDENEKRLRPATFAGWKRYVSAELVPVFGDREPHSITRREIRSFLEKTAVRSGWVSNRLLEVIRRIYTWGVENDRVGVSPCVGIKKLHEEESSERVLSPAELRAIWPALHAAGEIYADVVRLLFYTGCRLRSVLGMKREEIDFEAAKWVVPGGLGGRTKNKKPHVVPLVPAAVEIIKRHLVSADQEFVFPCAHKAKRRPMSPSSKCARDIKATADKIMGKPIPRWRLHDARTTMATVMREELKIPRDVVSAVLGHVQGGPAATRVYLRGELLEERRAALAAWAEWLARVTSPLQIVKEA
jgi:integrase